MTDNRNTRTCKQHGYGMIEIILGLFLTGILTAGVATFVFQTMDVTSGSKNRMNAIMQVENAGYWVSRDIQMSGNLTLGIDAGFPLELMWKDTDENEYQVTYSLTGGNISRSLIKNEDSPVQTLVAMNINSAESLTNISDTDGLIIFNITSTLEDIDISRTYKIKQRLELKE